MFDGHNRFVFAVTDYLFDLFENLVVLSVRNKNFPNASNVYDYGFSFAALDNIEGSRGALERRIRFRIRSIECLSGTS